MKFSNTLCVRIANKGDRENEFLIAALTAADAEDGERVAIYELKSMWIKNVKHSLIPVKNKKNKRKSA